VTTLTLPIGSMATLMDEVVAELARANPAGKSGTRVRRHEIAARPPRSGAAAGSTEPTGRRHPPKLNRPGTTGPADARSAHMATLKKIAKKLGRTSPLQGWRMRWHMQ
jgi:hypothetical protein